MDSLRVESGAAFAVLDPHIRASALRSDHRKMRDHILQRAQAAQPLGGKIAGNAAHAHAILPVGRDRNVDHRIVELRIIGEFRANPRIAGQLYDALMILAQLQLAGRTHHAVRFDAANRRLAQHHAVGGHRRALDTEHADKARARIGRAADDLKRAVPGIDGQHLQLVRLRMRIGGQHLGDEEAVELFRRILDAFDLKADVIQRGENLVEVRLGFQMLLEPAQRELHAPTPPESVGISSAEKP